MYPINLKIIFGISLLQPGPPKYVFLATPLDRTCCKGPGRNGAANNIVDFNKELGKYNFLVMTLITTVTFAAAFQVPGGYDDKGKPILVKSRDFRYFLLCDTLSFCSSAASLLIYFGMLVIQKMTFVQDIVQRVAPLLSVISLFFMFHAFSAGVLAVLDEKSSLYSLTNITALYGWAFPILLLYGIIIIPQTYIRYKLLRLFRS